MEERVAQRFGVAAAELAIEEQPLCPGEQVLADQDEFEPGGVWLEAAEGKVAQAAVFAAADPVFDHGVLAVQLFEPLGPAAPLGGDQKLEAVATLRCVAEVGPAVGPPPPAD